MEGRIMAKLSDEQQRQLDELTALQNQPDESDSEFEIEIWNDKGSGARIPYTKGSGWLEREFGITLDKPADPNGGDPNAPDPNAPDPESTARPRTSGKYFGGNRAPGK
jgi:hypothetical protein